MDVNGEPRRLMRLPLKMKSGCCGARTTCVALSPRKSTAGRIDSANFQFRSGRISVARQRSVELVPLLGWERSRSRDGYLKIERNAARVGRRSASPLWCHASVAIQCDKIRGCLPAIVSSVAAAIAVGSAPRSIFFGPGLVYIQRPSVHVPAVQRVDGSLPLAVISHLHESKPSRPSGVPVGYDVYAANRPKFLKEGSNGAFGCIEAEVSYKNILHLFFFLQLAEQRMRAG
jgi:hypothetical protein